MTNKNFVRNDPAIAAVREARHKISASVGHDPDKLLEHYQKRQQQRKERRSRSTEEVTTTNCIEHEHIDTDEEILEFDVPPRTHSNLSQYLRAPRRVKSPLGQVTIEICASETASIWLDEFHANIEWWNQNSKDIVNNSSLHNKYIAVSDGEVFSGDSYLEAYHKVHAAHVDAFPYIFLLKRPEDTDHDTNE